MPTEYTQIAENVLFSFKVFASAVYVTKDGDVVLSGKIRKGAKIPNIAPEFLETLCFKYSYEKYGQTYSISDLLAKDGQITFSQSVILYDKLIDNLNNKRITMITV